MVSKVKCPQCGKGVAWQADEIWKPFCSERCKLIDLGEWATEGHRIAGEPANDSDEVPNPSDYH